MTRRLSGNPPGLRDAPLHEFREESWSQWLTRQSRPTKPKQPRKKIPTNSAAAEALAAAVARKEAGDHGPVASSKPQK